jgi:membrane protease YdiL (CAAX protease family)
MSSTALRTYFLLTLPLLLIPSTALVFLLTSQWLGKDLGYVLGFLFYWLVWCLLVPFALLGRDRLRSLFHERSPLFRKANWRLQILLIMTTIGALFLYFIPEISHTPPLLMLIAVPVATINGFCEELLWRGVYVDAFAGHWIWGLLYPTTGFALWHISPQLVFPAQGGIGALVSSSFLLGLCYGLIAFETGSMRWTAVYHTLNGILAFGGALAPSLFNLLS